MAARTNRIAPDPATRARIQTSQLINRLQKFALSEDNSAEIDANRLRAIEILLKKTLPDLSAVELSGDTTTRVISADAMDEAAWARHYAERELASETGVSKRDDRPASGGTLQ